MRPWITRRLAVLCASAPLHAQAPIDRVDRNLADLPPVNGVDRIAPGPVAADGRGVVFFSMASDLVADAVGGAHLDARDRANGWPEASRANCGAGWPGRNGVPSISATACCWWTRS